MNGREQCCERHRRWLFAVALLAGGAGIGLGGVVDSLLVGRAVPSLVWVSVLGRLVATAGIVFAWSSLDARPTVVRVLRERFGSLVLGDSLRRTGLADGTDRGRTASTRKRSRIASALSGTSARRAGRHRSRSRGSGRTRLAFGRRAGEGTFQASRKRRSRLRADGPLRVGSWLRGVALSTLRAARSSQG